MKILALDFDGVISDSAAESFVVALRTYTRMRYDTKLVQVARGIELLSPEALRRHPLYLGFLELMPLGNRAEDFAVVLAILEAGIRVKSQADYDAQRNAQPRTFLDAFHTRFYAERRRLADGDRSAWLALLGPYPDFIPLLRRWSAQVILALATAKDRRTVAILLDDYRIADLFSDGRILDKEAGRGKRAHLTALSRRLGVDFSEMTFVDDKVNHLEDVAGLGVRCALAGWGYNGSREHVRAREQGFLVCELADVEHLLFGDA
jgi:phosphoglycolate phosphatase-like HAD superfamily hydrolase